MIQTVDKENVEPASAELNLADSSVYTQELSAKSPFKGASALATEPFGNASSALNFLDNSVFTQELSNKNTGKFDTPFSL